MTALTTEDQHQLAAYLATKERYEDLVARYAAASRGVTEVLTGRQLRVLRDAAGAVLDAMKAEAGEGGPSDPLCCQRYSKLHHPVFAVTGCRWYALRPSV